MNWGLMARLLVILIMLGKGAVETGVQPLMMMTSTIIDHFHHQNTTHYSGGRSEDGCVQLLVREGCEGNITILVVNNVVLF